MTLKRARNPMPDFVKAALEAEGLGAAYAARRGCLYGMARGGVVG